MLFLTKSLSFYFTNKDLGVRCWGVNLLAQRQRKQGGDFLLCLCLRKNALFYTFWKSIPPTRCPALLLPLTLSVSLSLSLTSLLPLTLYGYFQPTGCLLHISTYGWSYLNNVISGFTVWSTIPQRRVKERTDSLSCPLTSEHAVEHTETCMMHMQTHSTN